ncbi:translocation protein SEC62-like [Tubulanus polymorphus]|uniref:translocation protein SEC62-like n=1 Tax=Tubulanus polymorphus TaxID=672921 RepID=UPI003DA2C91E
MAEKRRSGKKSRRDEDDEKPSKEEYAVAKYVRFNCPVKESKFMGMPVKSFIASEAVNLLLDSRWATKGKSDAIFTNRQSVVHYMDRLLMKRLFHRAIRSEKKKKKLKDEDDANGEDEKEKKLRKRGKKEKDTETEAKDSEKKEKDSEKKDEKKKKEKKMKLKMTDDQAFYDGDEIYVWVYDPVPLKTFLIGLLLVLGSIAVCLFPLWPPEVRQGVYYLSLSAIGFIGIFLLLVVVRFIVFCCVWLATLGKHHFWFLPNLTEDVGFVDSFRPLYTHEMKPAVKPADESTKNEPTESGEANNDKNEDLPEKKMSEKTKKNKKSSSAKMAEDDDEANEEAAGKDKESDKEDGSTGSEDYEMVEKSDVTEDTDDPEPST